ncbi:MAG: aspartate kinase [Acidobacteria bacterium]|nr:aspartate kinase [Acidobacteriota bacterium]
MVVMKFGGTSVADQAAIERLMGIVARQRDEDIAAGDAAPGPVVVVSALSGVTDRLLGVAAEAGAGDNEGARHNLRDLRARHMTVAEVIGDETLRAAARAGIDREFDELERIVDALGVLREVSPRWLDTIAATGEIVSSRIVAAALAARGLKGAWVDARTVVVTSADHIAAVPQFAETTAALEATVRPLLADGHVPVLGGFVGATTDGVTTTLGRGGSDFSGAIVGSCLDAAEIQIWTDVDGMLTADPRVVAHPRVVPHISFAEASELAYFGAKVLHPATIQPAVARDIPVRILNSKRADAPGTLITANRPPSDLGLTALASKKHVTIVDITSTRMLMAHGFLRRLFEVFERHKTPVDVVTTSEVSVSVTVDDRRRLPAIVEALSEFAEVSLEHEMAIVCAVGEGLSTEPRLVARVFEAVGDVPVKLLSQAATRRNITFVIRETDVPLVLGRLHEAFFAAAGAGGRA